VKEQQEKITDKDLKEALIEEKKKVLDEHREEIIKRAHLRLKQKFGHLKK